MRADARRNHERLLAVAREAFAERGADASLEEIAHRAGVGSGTLYRHFPTRETLLDAVLQDWRESVEAERDELLATLPPAEALHAWFRSYLSQIALYRGLAAALMVGMSETSSGLYGCGQSMKGVTADILGRAQAAGEIRADVIAPDLLKLIKGIVLAAEQAGGGEELVERLLSLVMDGLRAPATRSSAPAPA